MGFFLTLLLLAAVFVASEFLRPKNTQEDARPSGRGDFTVPTASEDRFNPIIWGTVMLEGPNVTWWTLVRQVPIGQGVANGLFFTEEVVTGYRYIVAIQMALCRGPIDAIIGIHIADKPVFSGVQGAGTIEIFEPALFGGEQFGSGGIIGDVDVLVGTTSQAPNSYLETYQTITAGATPNAPRYGGSCYVVAKDMYVGTSTQIAAWKFEVRRIPNGLGLVLGEAVLNSGNDANAINVAFEILTNSEWGLGYPTASIDTTNFKAAAATLATENNGFSFVLDSGREAPEVLEEIARQIDGVFRVNKTTGLWEVKLQRADYVIDDEPQILDDDVREVADYTRPAWTETTNELRVIFNHRGSEYNEVPALAQDAANIGIQGRVVGVRSVYPGVKDPALAAIIVWRDLRTLSYPLISARLKVGRKFYAISRGDIVVWTDTQRGLDQVAFRVSAVDYGTIQEGTIELALVEDIFRFEAAAFGTPDPTRWVPPQDTLQPLLAAEQLAFEAPRKFLVLEGTVADRIWCGARQRDVAASFQIVERNASGVPAGAFADAGEAFGFLLIGKLLGALNAGSPVPLATLVLDPDPDTQDALRDVFSPRSAQEIGVELRNLIYIGGEFMGVESAEDVGLNVQLNNVYRPLSDTVQVDHSAGALVWLVFVAGNLTRSIFSPAYNVDLKLLPKSRSDQVTEGEAATIAVALANRLRSPYPPSRIILNTVPYPASVSLEGSGSDGDDYGVAIDFTRRDFRSSEGDEVEALTVDAASLFGDFPAANDTKYGITVREDPGGSNLLVATFTDVQPPQTVLRNEILLVTDGVLPSVLRFIVEAKHTETAVVYTALQDLLYDPAATSGLTGDFNFGALNGFEISNVYTATTAGQFDFVLVSALPSSTTTVEYRLNGGAWTTLIAATQTTGNIAAVAVSDTIEIRHTEVSADLRRFIGMTAPGGGQDGYAVLFTGAFAPDSLTELTAWWNFSDKGDLNLSGITILGAFDKSGNGNDLTQSGVNRPSLTTINSMFMGQFTESPSGEWMSVADDPALNFGSGDFTIFVVYRTGDNDRATLIDKGVTLKYFVRINDVDVSPTGKFRFDINDGSTKTVLDSGINYADSAVRLLTMRRDGNNLRSYADGVETAASPTDITAVGSIDGATPFYLGARQGGSQYLEGQIGEVIMYKGTITVPELALVHDWLKTKWGL